MPDWPRTYVPLDADGQLIPDGEPLELFLHRPDLTEDLLAWSGGTVLTLNGGPVILLPGTAPAGQRLVGLGDHALRSASGQLRAEPADGFATRYQPAEQ